MRSNHLKAYLFLSILAAPFWSTYLFFNVQRSLNQTSISRRIKNVDTGLDLMILKVPAFLTKTSNPEFEWKGDDEFRFRGMMYDIKSSRQQGDTIYFTCYKDEWEGRLFQQLEAAIAQFFESDPLPFRVNDQIMQFYLMNYLVPSLFAPEQQIMHFCSSKPTSLIQSLDSWFMVPPIPPPRLS